MISDKISDNDIMEEGVMDYHAIAEQILKYTGGKENLISAAHCATRLRLVIADNDKCDSAAVENVDAVKGYSSHRGRCRLSWGQELLIRSMMNLLRLRESARPAKTM